MFKKQAVACVGLIHLIVMTLACQKPPKMHPPMILAPQHYTFNIATRCFVVANRNNLDEIMIGIQKEKYGDYKDIIINTRTGEKKEVISDKLSDKEFISILPHGMHIGNEFKEYKGEFYKISFEGKNKKKVYYHGTGQNLLIATGIKKVEREYFTGHMCFYVRDKLLYKQFFENASIEFYVQVFPKRGIIFFDPFAVAESGHARDVVIIKTEPFDPVESCRDYL